jgi:hypothetical protein
MTEQHRLNRFEPKLQQQQIRMVAGPRNHPKALIAGAIGLTVPAK